MRRLLRIAQAKNPLDNTSVHPESYTLAEQILAELGFDLKHCNDIAVQEAAAKADASAIAVKLNAGLPTVTDILEALARPGARSARRCSGTADTQKGSKTERFGDRQRCQRNSPKCC